MGTSAGWVCWIWLGEPRSLRRGTEAAEGQHCAVMFSTRLEGIMGELGELVSHELLPGRRVQVAAARNTQLFEVILGTHVLRCG